MILLILAVIGQAIGSVLLWQEKEQTKRKKEQTKQEKDRADQQRSQAENNLAFSYQILDGIYMDVAVNLGHQPVLTPKDKQFLEGMRTLYEKVAEQGGDTPATRLRTARAYHRRGALIEGSTTRRTFPAWRRRTRTPKGHGPFPQTNRR